MNAYKLMFIIFSVAIVIFSILTVTSRKILRAAVYLLFVLISTSGIYFWLNYQFMAAVQLTLYAGGIVVLIIFSILLTHQIDHKFDVPSWKKVLPAALASLSGMLLTLYAILTYNFVPTDKAPVAVDMKVIGNQLMGIGENGYALPFEVISILLLAAMIGAIIIAKKGK
ncbi:MAG: NADH-quinone oxidoreductase subunit J [Bacteroidota bacterium]